MNIIAPNSHELRIAEQLFEAYPFSLLLLNSGNGEMPTMSHLPMLYDRNQHAFFCHISNQNPLLQRLQQGAREAKLVVTGEHGYISPTWSAEISVPTWDYCVVHVEGSLVTVDDPQAKRHSMIQQIKAHETQWQLDTLDAPLQQQKFSAITVLKLEIEQMRCRYKLSQSKSHNAKAAIVDNFTRLNNEALVRRYQQNWNKN